VLQDMDTVKVKTPGDFEDAVLSPKRKKHSSIACSHCRKLKIRCQGGQSALKSSRRNSQPCDYCTQHSRRCDWPDEDGRKLKRQRSRSPSQPGNLSLNTRANAPAGLNGNGMTPATNFSIVDEHQERGLDFLPETQLRLTNQHPASTTNGENSQASEVTSRRSFSSATETPYTTVHYYRHHGPTAIAPGHKQISLKARHDELESPGDGQHVNRETQANERAGTNARNPSTVLFDDDTDLPTSNILPQLLDTFFEYYGDSYCFLNKDHILQLVGCGKPPVFLVNVMSALSSRFCHPSLFAGTFPPVSGDARREAWEYSAPFLEKAKSMVMSALSLPSIDGVAGLLLLAFADFGDNNEAGM